MKKSSHDHFEHPDYKQVKKELSKEECPWCQESKFTLKIECDMGKEGCVYIAECQSCHHSFVISTLTRKLIEDDPKVEKKLDKMVCPTCKHKGAVMHFRYDLGTKQCFYFVGCPQCGKTHEEYR